MKSLKIFQVDAFASAVFQGNPAAVCPLDTWLTDTQMQSIAAENNLSETVFFVPQGEGFHIRWFTPNEEIALCGHATLAAAYILFDHLGFNGSKLIFSSLSGELIVQKTAQGLVMDFPELPYHEIELTPQWQSLNLKRPAQVFKSRFDLMFVYGDAADVQEAHPDLNAVAALDYRGLILTAPGINTDIYSRCFYPGCDVPEDPVTGSAHCVIAPFWCERLAKPEVTARQGGKRQGELSCVVKAGRVLLYGTCHLYLEGIIHLS